MARSVALGEGHPRLAAPRVVPPGLFVDAGAHRLHVVSRGEGAPAVLLESGIAASSLSWARVQPELAKFTRACAYDRAGLAWSETAPPPLMFDRILQDLHTVAASIDAVAPIILVGHSFGSLVVRGYAARHPDRVAGLVLVDPPTEWIEGAPERIKLLGRAIQASTIGSFLARVGVVRAALALLTGGLPAVPRTMVKVMGRRASGTLERLVGEVRKLPPELYPAVQSHWSQPKCFDAMAAHLRVLKTEGTLIAMATPPPHIPVVVISGGHQPASEIAVHRCMAEASPRGRHVVAEHSGHWIMFDQPEVIVDAVRSLIAARPAGAG
jgi:pimeloyl-ACP methyl ester carboxylesterase